MEFASRDRYRHVIERISKRTSRFRELESRSSCVGLRKRRQQKHDAREAHVGYYLIDDGLLQLEGKFGYSPNAWENVCSAGVFNTRPYPISASSV